MSRTVRKQLFSTLATLTKANQILNKLLVNGKTEDAASLLVECQDCAIAIGTQIDRIYGEDTASVHELEEYCELVYLLSENLNSYAQRGQIYEQIFKQVTMIQQTMEREIPDKLEVVFLPYKASMWDSLESIYLAARADENCDAYCVPIPYFDKNRDGSFGEMHYEGGEYPEDVPVIAWQEYDFGIRRPDMVFIHNPYDEYNFVTSVHPFFYSKNLKQYTDTLIYIPYYTTSGGMNEARSQCSAYYYADYIVIQAEKYRHFFDSNLPQEKLLAFGSPKFDRVIRMCKNQPEAPADWKEKMTGKKVYFYNTSIAGMLANTPAFLKKMKYVFECFAKREDACLLWRPHPLLESSFDSMRAEVKPIYDALKNYFFESNLGIYDDTADVTRAIALSDAYIGDASSSVISLFGLAGKPIFILNNNIHATPEENDWWGEVIKMPVLYGNTDWMITQGNKLYHSAKSDYTYRYCCDLSQYSGDNYYSQVVTIEGKNYACPINAQDILIVNESGIERKITLKHMTEQAGAFYGATECGRFLFLIPNRYPAIVKYDTVSEQVEYLTGFADVYREGSQGARRLGGFCAKDGYVYLASPTDNRVLQICAETGEMTLVQLQAENMGGCSIMISEGEELWLLPYSGNIITKWNPETGEVRQYADVPQGLQCRHPVMGYECDDNPFGRPAFCGEYMYFPPWYGNMYIKLNKCTGQMEEWHPPFEHLTQPKNGYYVTAERGGFIGNDRNKVYRLFSAYDKRLYEVNFESNEYTELKIKFDNEELMQCEPGFCRRSEWIQYACVENAFNSLGNFLNGSIIGDEFDRERQIRAYGTISANYDGTCGEKVYQYLRDELDKR